MNEAIFDSGLYISIASIIMPQIIIRSHTHLHTVHTCIHTANSPMLVTDANSKIIQANKVAVDTFGYPEVGR